MLEGTKAKCGEAVLKGELTVNDYEELTGISGDNLRAQLKAGIRMEYRARCGAIREMTLEHTREEYQKLVDAGMADEETVKTIFGAITLDEAGTVLEPDWAVVGAPYTKPTQEDIKELVDLCKRGY